MLFATAFIAVFIVGGLSGVMHASPPAVLQQSATYFIVAHIHYVLFGGTIFGLFGGIYYWFPKVSGRLLSESAGKVHFWLTMVGMNIAFFPMHFLGLDGMPRRIYTYGADMGWSFWNLVSTLGVYLIIVGTLIFIGNIVWSVRSGVVAFSDPWDAATLEWSIPSPPPEHNFDRIPVVASARPLWDWKYGAAHSHESHAHAPIAGAQHGDDGEHIHMPNPSYWPLVTAVGLAVIAFGILFWIPMAIFGVFLLFFGINSWAFEPAG